MGMTVICFHNNNEENGYLSNWYPSTFTHNGITFSSMEQYMMYRKALSFGDEKVATQILATDNAAEIKALGRLVSGYDESLWNGIRQIVVYEGLFAKFTQNPDLRERLKDTGNAFLAECAVNDRIWGIGLSMRDPSRLDRAKWQGQNLLGYPEMAPYPNEMEYFDEKTGEFDSDGFDVVYDAWQSDRKAQRSQPEGYADGLEPFFASSIREFLSNSNGENKVYSPLSVYMALAMLAEVTDSESRQQILDLLGSESIEALRSQAASVWNANYSNDGAVTSILANSLWLNESVNFNQSTMDSLAKNYYASSFRGEMGSEEFNQALRDWINEQTGGLLEAQADGLSMDPETVMALASTIYYRAKWHSEFNEAGTEKGLFHLFSADGETVECDFMHKGGSNTYYWADQFGAVALSLEGSGKMWFLLPDDGVAMDDLLADEQTMEFLNSNGNWENSKHLIVNMSVPKFDVVSDLDLRDGLNALGITGVFDATVADFSPMTSKVAEIFLSKADHAARVAIDEEGVTAAAYTVMMMAGAAAPPEEEMDFVLDRPFLFAITGADGLPLFVGVVNRP